MQSSDLPCRLALRLLRTHSVRQVAATLHVSSITMEWCLEDVVGYIKRFEELHASLHSALIIADSMKRA